MKCARTLEEYLTKALAKGCRFTLHHLSTPPSPCSAIFAAAPGHRPDETYCENQFLSVSIEHEGRQLQVFAIEVIIYTTQFLTTLFISKADSTGCLHLLGTPSGTLSPLKTLATTFLHYLGSERKRPGRRLVLSLFARAQNQYLFPGSVENGHKHVLDDRGLIKWWCRVLDPLLEEHTVDTEQLNQYEGPMTSGIGYLRVPGYDAYGVKTFFPRVNLRGVETTGRWRVSDPLQELGRFPDLPERCLIPRFPDDPKARFVETLDDELPDDTNEYPPSRSPGCMKRNDSTGKWRSIKSLDQFWEAMSFRQECSSGRLVGFIWAVFTPHDLRIQGQDSTELRANQISPTAMVTSTDSLYQQTDHPEPIVPQFSDSSTVASATPSLSDPVSREDSIPTPVQIKEAGATKCQPLKDQPELTRYYYWPTSSRGEVILGQKEYDRVGRLLLSLDYANEEAAAASTRTWVHDVSERAGIKIWGKIVTGEKEAPISRQPVSCSDGGATMLGDGLVRKKKRNAEGEDSHDGQTKNDGVIKTLSAGLMRKKAKTTNSSTANAELETTEMNTINPV